MVVSLVLHNLWKLDPSKNVMMTSTEKSDCTMKIQGKCIVLDNSYLLCRGRRKKAGCNKDKGDFCCLLWSDDYVQ